MQASNNARTLALNTTNPGVLWNTGSYTYDGSGNIITIGDTSGYDDLYRYDKVNRLTRAYVRDAATGDSTRQDYTYDVFGNMTEVKTWPASGGTQTTTIAVNANTNRLSVAGYDASGNMTSWGSDAYSYDTSNSMTEQNGRWFFLYNFSGERVATIDWQGSIATREVDFTIRGPGNQVLSTFNLVGEDQSGNWTHEMDYIWMGRRLLGTEDGSGTQKHYHTDHLGSIRLVTDSLGAKVSEHEFLPYGEELTAAGNGVMKFTGHERDADTGMDYMHARFYTSHLGRFMGADPVLGTAGGPSQRWNRYGYVMSNPLAFNDPTGMTNKTAHQTTSTKSPCTPINTSQDQDGNTVVTLVCPSGAVFILNSNGIVSMADSTTVTAQDPWHGRRQTNPFGNRYPFIRGVAEIVFPEEGRSLSPCMQAMVQSRNPNFDASNVRVHDGIPSLVEMFQQTGGRVGAFTFGDHQWYSDEEGSSSYRLVTHETSHSAEFDRRGTFGFVVDYLTGFLRSFQENGSDQAYSGNTHEQGARWDALSAVAENGTTPCPPAGMNNVP